ncbi:MAG TPA: phosphatase PAP2 family protein [Acidimicrobiia bacterium]|nr:phosphatase PAP2 family protein [Acidimicrobiia bacterium]
MSRTRTATAFATLGWSAAVASRGVPGWDAAVFRRINALPHSFVKAVWAPMQAGALAAPLVVATGLLARRQPSTAARIAVTGLTAWVSAKAMKSRVTRGRPGDHIAETQLRFGSADEGLGYPSGHAAVVTTLASGLTRHAGPGWKGAGAVLVTIVGLSRIYVGAHYPLDVVGGVALGVAISEVYDLVSGSG